MAETILYEKQGHVVTIPLNRPDAVNSITRQLRGELADAITQFDGDADAFGALYDRYQPEILRYLTHRVRAPEVAEDLAQHVFLKAWQAMPRYQQRGVPFKAWLYRMAHNQMVDHYRAHRERHFGAGRWPVLRAWSNRAKAPGR